MDAPSMTTKQHQEAAALGSGSSASNSGPTGINSSAVAPHQSPRNAMVSGSGVAVEVSKALQDGDKFVKWDDVSGADVAMREQTASITFRETSDTDTRIVCEWVAGWVGSSNRRQHK